MKIVGICGEPATGKSTLMRALLGRMDGEEQTWHPEKWGTLEYLQMGDFYVLGKYDEHPFDGTDRLSMAVINDAEAFLLKLIGTDAVILFEGDRLYCDRFIKFIVRNSQFMLIELVNSATESNQRRKERAGTGINQSETFLKSRRTKYRNLRTKFPFIRRALNCNLSDQATVLSTILDFIAPF